MTPRRVCDQCFEATGGVRAYLIGKLYRETKKEQGGDRGNQYTVEGGHFDHLAKTAERIGERSTSLAEQQRAFISCVYRTISPGTMPDISSTREAGKSTMCRGQTIISHRISDIDIEERPTLIMENFSKNKRGRGRPRKWTWVDPTNYLWDDVEGMSRRTQVNLELDIRAEHALGFFADGDERQQNIKKYNWLFPYTPGGNRKQGKRTVLYELGRLDDDDQIRILAENICERKYSAKDANQYIREVKRLWREQGLL